VPASSIRDTVSRTINKMIAYRPCQFYVEHNEVSTANGGRQGDPQTLGPYRGMITAPGSTRSTMRGVSSGASQAGAVTESDRWSLLSYPFVKIGFGSPDNDYVRVIGFGRFKVAMVRPVANIIPPVGVIIGMDELT
jgi:hypothetical protein